MNTVITTTYPLTKTFLVLGHQVKLIQFKPNDTINIRVNTYDKEDSNVPFNIYNYVIKEQLNTQEFLTQP